MSAEPGQAVLLVPVNMTAGAGECVQHVVGAWLQSILRKYAHTIRTHTHKHTQIYTYSPGRTVSATYMDSVYSQHRCCHAMAGFIARDGVQVVAAVMGCMHIGLLCAALRERAVHMQTCMTWSGANFGAY